MKGNKNKGKKRQMNFNLTTLFGFKLQLTICFYDAPNDEFTLAGINLIKSGKPTIGGK